MIQVPTTNDIIQQIQGKLKIPEIRVWCHPHRINKSGDDYYEVFEGFAEAIKFCKMHKEAEEVPLIAYDGYEMNIFDYVKEKK